MEQLVILLIIGLISFINWLLQKSAERKAQRKTEERLDHLDRPVEAEPVEAHPSAAEERTRKFLEALGLPTDAIEPPVERHPAPPPIPEPLIRPAPAPDFTPKVNRDLERRLAGEAPAIFRPPSRPAPKRAPTRHAPTPTSTSDQTLREALQTPGGLRNAILAREILGTPKGLQF